MVLSQIFNTLGISGSDAIIFILVGSGLIQIAPIKINPWSWIFSKFGNLINCNLSKDIHEIKNDLTTIKIAQQKIEKDFDKQKAISARIRILAFADEIIHGMNRSKESYYQILEDIDLYDKYCDDNPDFVNHKTLTNTTIILSSFQKILENEYKAEIEANKKNGGL